MVHIYHLNPQEADTRSSKELKISFSYVVKLCLKKVKKMFISKLSSEINTSLLYPPLDYNPFV